jgi:hypothetical protein
MEPKNEKNPCESSKSAWKKSAIKNFIGKINSDNIKVVSGNSFLREKHEAWHYDFQYRKI